MSEVNWNYTSLAKHYDNRVDYAKNIVSFIAQEENLLQNSRVAEIGAGTGKLTKLLIKAKFVIDSIEPNEAMREIGVKNVPQANWGKGTAESTNLSQNTYDSIWFGSSFNVINLEESLEESKRICKPSSLLVCMWNHRFLLDKKQIEIEQLIKNALPDFAYGTRRNDPTQSLINSGLFEYTKKISIKFDATVSSENYINAWKSHATLKRQCKNEHEFNSIIEMIASNLRDKSNIIVPFETNAWFARFK
jgi:ubiquinone/menaquinone biosynthesis C-methylase UbiE